MYVCAGIVGFEVVSGSCQCHAVVRLACTHAENKTAAAAAAAAAAVAAAAAAAAAAASALFDEYTDSEAIHATRGGRNEDAQ